MELAIEIKALSFKEALLLNNGGMYTRQQHELHCVVYVNLRLWPCVQPRDTAPPAKYHFDCGNPRPLFPIHKHSLSFQVHMSILTLITHNRFT